MRKVTVIIVLFSMGLFAGDKIGFIDSNRILQEYKGTKDLQKKYNEKINEWQRKAEKMKKEIEELQRQFQTQQVILSETAKARKLQEIQEKQKEYENFLQSIWGPDGEAKKLNDQLMKPFLAKVDSILKKIGEEEGYIYILDISSGVVVYADPGLDITDRVIDELNREFGPEVAGEEKVYFYIAKFKDIGGEAAGSNLGERIKNTILASIKDKENLEQTDLTAISSAMSSEGVVNEEDITQDKALKVAEKTNTRIFVFGNVEKTGEDVTINYFIVNGETASLYSKGTIKTKDSAKLYDDIKNVIVQKIAQLLK